MPLVDNQTSTFAVSDPVLGAEGADGSTGRRTPPLACGTPPLDANAPAFTPWTDQQYSAVANALSAVVNVDENAPMMDQYWAPQNEVQARMAAAKAKKAVEAAAQEHPGWSAVASQIDDPRKKMPDRNKVRPTGPSGVEKQRALVAACVKARSRPLTHSAPPTNLADMHRRILEAANGSDEPKRASQDELTPRFPPSNCFEEAPAHNELPRILGRSAFSMSPKAEDAIGLDLKFLDEDDDTPGDGSAFLRNIANPFLPSAVGNAMQPNLTPPCMPPSMPPQPRFLRAKEAA